MSEKEGMTVYFEFDVREFKGNPYMVDTPFGRPKVISRGDIISERDQLESDLEDMKDDARDFAIERDLNT